MVHFVLLQISDCVAYDPLYLLMLMLTDSSVPHTNVQIQAQAFDVDTEIVIQ